MEGTNGGSAQPLRGAIPRAEEGHEPRDTVITAAKSQPVCVCVCVCARAYAHELSHIQLFVTP